MESKLLLEIKIKKLGTKIAIKQAKGQKAQLEEQIAQLEELLAATPDKIAASEAQTKGKVEEYDPISNWKMNRYTVVPKVLSRPTIYKKPNPLTIIDQKRATDIIDHLERNCKNEFCNARYHLNNMFD